MKYFTYINKALFENDEEIFTQKMSLQIRLPLAKYNNSLFRLVKHKHLEYDHASSGPHPWEVKRFYQVGVIDYNNPGENYE